MRSRGFFVCGEAGVTYLPPSKAEGPKRRATRTACLCEHARSDGLQPQRRVGGPSRARRGSESRSRQASRPVGPSLRAPGPTCSQQIGESAVPMPSSLSLTCSPTEQGGRPKAEGYSHIEAGGRAASERRLAQVSCANMPETKARTTAATQEGPIGPDGRFLCEHARSDGQQPQRRVGGPSRARRGSPRQDAETGAEGHTHRVPVRICLKRRLVGLPCRRKARSGPDVFVGHASLPRPVDPNLRAPGAPCGQ